jgi:hypothetical protein
VPQFAKISNLVKTSGLVVGRWGAASGCGWRRQPQDMEGSSEYIEYVIAEHIRIRPAAGNLADVLTPPHCKSKYIKNDVESCGLGRHIWNDLINGKYT